MSLSIELKEALALCDAAYIALELAEAEVNYANLYYNRVIARLGKEEEVGE